jgi:hypothetical protein
MGSSTSSIPTEPIVAAAAVAGALGYGYVHYFRPAARFGDEDAYSDANVGASNAPPSKLRGQKKRGRKLLLPGDATLKNLDILDPLLQRWENDSDKLHRNYVKNSEREKLRRLRGRSLGTSSPVGLMFRSHQRTMHVINHKNDHNHHWNKSKCNNSNSTYPCTYPWGRRRSRKRRKGRKPRRPRIRLLLPHWVLLSPW